MKTFDEIVAKCPSSVSIGYARCELDPADQDYVKLPLEAIVSIGYSEPGWGWGSFTFHQGPNGELYLDTECTNPAKVKAALAALVDKAITDHDLDPQNHLAYNKAVGRICGKACIVCHPKGSP